MADPEREPPDPSVTEPQSRRAAVVFVGGLLAVLAVVGIVALLAGGDDEVTEAPATTLVCEPVPADGASEDCPQEAITEPAAVDVVTSEGEFTISLDTEGSPATTTSFRTLVESGFYDGLEFHRVAPGFVIQGGDPNGDGSGGPGYYVDEDVPAGTEYTPGVVAMAKTSTDPAGRSGSQFFVVSGPGGAQLTPDYAVVGEVTAGMEAVDAIDALGPKASDPGVSPDGRPTRPVTIESMSVTEPS